MSKKDNIIDWSAFDESVTEKPVAPGSGLFKIMAAVFFLAVALGCVRGGMGLNDAFRMLGEDNGTSMVVSPAVQSQFIMSVLTLALSLGTLVPAAFSMSAAAQRKDFLSHLLIAVCGLVLSGLAFVVGVALGSSEASAVDPVWALFTVLAVAYLVVAIIVSVGSRQSKGAHETKEEIWDEKEIWKE